MIVFTDAEKYLIKSIFLHDKSSEKIRYRSKVFDTTKAIYNNQIYNILWTGEKLKAFSLRSGIRKECPLSSPSFRRVLEVLARAIRQEEDMIGIQI